MQRESRYLAYLVTERVIPSRQRLQGEASAG
jgi:hypothetical protein